MRTGPHATSPTTRRCAETTRRIRAPATATRPLPRETRMSAETDSGESQLFDHLLELRARIIRGLMGLGVALLAMLPFANRLYAWLAQPLIDKLPEGAHLIAVEVASPFFAPLKL